MTDAHHGSVGNSAPLIAVIGCDGSGKTTLSAELIEWLEKRQPTDTVYLGLGSGKMGNQIKEWPVIGKWFETILSRKAKQTRTKGEKIPDVFTASVIYYLSWLRYRRFTQVVKMRRRGITVITDRYPQIEIPGFFDGPGLSAAAPTNVVTRFLAAQELKLYMKMVAHVPTLVLRLNVSVETAYARKSDHEIGLLTAKVAATPRLKFNGAHIVDLDAEMDYARELTLAKEAISGVLNT